MEIFPIPRLISFQRAHLQVGRFAIWLSLASASLLTKSQQPEPLPMYAHTCTGEIDVALNGTLVEYITDTLPPNDDGSLVTQFDIWLHSNLMRSCGGEDFTAL